MTDLRRVIKSHGDPVDANEALVAYLKKNFAMPLPTVDVDERQLWINVGKAQVVEHFLRLHERQYNK